MTGLFSAIGILILYSLALGVVIFALQYLSKKYYEHLMKKHGESSIFLRKFAEADTWEVFVVVVVVMAFWYWITGGY